MNNEQNTQANGPEFWLSLDQYNGNPEFAKRAEAEFMSSPLKSEDGKDGVARREFLKLMGASLAMATTACVRRPVQHIIPYAQGPKEIVPGIPNFYASSWFDGVEGSGVLVKTLEGRPIKMEGNPLHPMNLGSLTARAHAEVLALYDPDRLKGPAKNLLNKTRSNKETISTNWKEADDAIVAELKKGGVAVLSSSLPSPSARAMVSDFLKAYPGQWVQYDSMPADSVAEANRRCYGRAQVPGYRFDKAKMVVAIDADFLGTYLSPAEFMKQWSKRRVPGPEMGRLVMFEANVSLTGLNADDRFRIRPSQQLDVVLGLLNEVVKAGGKLPAGGEFLKSYGDVASKIGVKPEMFAQIGRELWENRGKGLVIAGGLPTLTGEAVDLQIAVNLLNSVLGNDGATIDYEMPFQTRQGSGSELSKLIADMHSGKIKTLIIHNLNPAYVLPASSGFSVALMKVPFVVYTGNRNDETGRYANYVLPSGTTLENWGDWELRSGIVAIQQPTIRPLHDSRAFEESLLAWTQKAAGAPARAKAGDWYEYVRGIWKNEVQAKSSLGRGKSFDEFWAAVLQTGVNVAGAETSAPRALASRSVAAGAVAFKARTPVTGTELVLFPTIQMGDGRYANISWLQELPDPVTKIVWDNYAMISPARARNEKINEGDIIEISMGDRSLKVPAHVQPGMHDEVVALSVGYGRPDPGKVAKGIGHNGYDLSTFANGQAVFAGQAIKIKKTGEKYLLVSTQEHHVMEGRQIVVEATNSAFMKDPGAGIHRHKIFSIWPDHKYTKRKWAMAIDLNQCTGCSACMVACSSENNIPVVGKRYVFEGREMHWIRIDRYYNGTPEKPEAVFQPMLCQQCETAPCETVCPVLATVHNDEGLNDMIYNRCVGTRYCSNNCPYKVRRFNWFNYGNRQAPLHMALNPDVTVRTRGVMEKCTFCVQRIRFATSVARNTKDKLPDGEIKTACQQTCPTNAITFGDLNDKDSAVAKLFENKRSYSLLEELNTQPRVRYMSRVRNAEREKPAAHGGGHHAKDRENNVKPERHEEQGGHV